MSTCQTTGCAFRAWYRSISGSISSSTSSQALEERAAALYHDTISQAEVSEWIDTHLASYGKDARGLVREAMTAYVSTEREQAERRGGTDALQRLQHLKAMEKRSSRRQLCSLFPLPLGEG